MSNELEKIVKRAKRASKIHDRVAKQVARLPVQMTLDGIEALLADEPKMPSCTDCDDVQVLKMLVRGDVVNSYEMSRLHFTTGIFWNGRLSETIRRLRDEFNWPVSGFMADVEDYSQGTKRRTRGKLMFYYLNAETRIKFKQIQRGGPHAH